MKRASGILLPVFSLSSNYGIGTFGKEAQSFILFLEKAHQSYWQMLPLNPTSYGDSPYQSFSAFALNPYFIDLDLLADDKLLTKTDLKTQNQNYEQWIDYGKIYHERFLILRKAYSKAIKNNYKNLKSGNNMSNKNLKEIEEYILSIRSYNAKIEVEIQSNKNKNKYVLEQKYAEPNVQKQIVLEPSNIEGLETIFDGNNLKINNTKLNLSTIYENYSDVTSNFLWLNTFTEEYKKMIETGKQNIIEQNGIIIMEIKDADELNKKLYIDRKTGKPIKMQIKNVSKNTTVYILYNEIEINSLKRDDVLAFRLKNVYVNM